MKISTQKTITIPLTPAELELGTAILLHNLGFKPGESIAIITDTTMLAREARVWIESARTLTSKVTVLVVEGMTHSGEEPPDEVVTAVRNADISLLHTLFSLTHTQAGKAIVAAGNRGFSLPGVTYDFMFQHFVLDYADLKQRGDKIKKVLEMANTIRISSPNGTNIIGTIRRDKVYNDCGFLHAGEIGNLPAGEVFFAPILGSVSGKLVIDGSIADDALDAPITIDILNGVAKTIIGGVAAKNLEKKLRQFGQKGLTVAEIGIGTNRKANPRGDLTEAEKAAGTIHVAFGNSSAIGGENDVPIHLDGVVLQPQVKLDGTIYPL